MQELSKINLEVKGDIETLNNTKMNNQILVKDNLVNLIAKIGEKLQLEEQNFLIIQMELIFFMFIQLEQKCGKIISVKLDGIFKTKMIN